MQNRATLLILAAGIGSRYGGLKQLDSVGLSGETILEYSIYDAIRAGFHKVVFVVRENILNQFRSIFDKKLKGLIEVEYVTQELNKIPFNFEINKKRQKPWGTAHAVWVAENTINTNFAVINADDFYGFDAFAKMFNFLAYQCDNENYALVCYKLSNTISEYGGVSRGICTFSNDYLASIKEYHQITNENNNIIGLLNNKKVTLSFNSLTSMNFWGFPIAIFKQITSQFKTFLKMEGKELKSEFYIPVVIDNLLRQNMIKVKVLQTKARWHGITYKEDKPLIMNSLKEYVKKGIYPSNLWA